MTYGQKSPIPSAAPESVADAIWRAYERKQNDVYLPGFWRGIMGLVKGIPETYFKRMDF